MNTDYNDEQNMTEEQKFNKRGWEIAEQAVKEGRFMYLELNEKGEFTLH